MNKPTFCFKTLTPFLCLILSGLFFTPTAMSDVEPSTDIQTLANWIKNQQYTNSSLPSYGAIKLQPDQALSGGYYAVSPYVANLAIVGLLQSPVGGKLEVAQRCINWYLNHINSDGTIYDWWWSLADGTGETACPPGIDPTYCNRIEAEDSTPATFFRAAWSYYEAGGSAAFLNAPGNKEKIERIAASLLAMQQPNGLTWGTRNYPIEQMMDNAEAYGGLVALAKLERFVFMDSAKAGLYETKAQMVKNGITTNLYDPVTGLYHLERSDATNPPSIHRAHLDIWYVGTIPIIWPLLYGIPEMAQAQMDAFNKSWDGIPEWLVWKDDKSGKGDIYLYDLTAHQERSIAGGLPLQKNPFVSGNFIVWQEYRGNWDIYLYDLTTNSTYPISTAPGDQTNPVVLGNKIVWEDNRNGNPDLYFYYLGPDDLIGTRDCFVGGGYCEGEYTLIVNPAAQRHPAISSDDWIAWEDNRNGDWDIYFSPFLGQEGRVNQDPVGNHVDQVNPSFSDYRIAWEDYRNGNADIYIYDFLGGEHRITNESHDQKNPAICGDRVVWEDYRNGNADIYLYDLGPDGLFGTNDCSSQGRCEGEFRITANSADQKSPSISGDKIVWEDYRSGNPDIYLYDLSTGGIEQNITMNSANQWHPVLNKTQDWTTTRVGRVPWSSVGYTALLAGDAGNIDRAVRQANLIKSLNFPTPERINFNYPSNVGDAGFLLNTLSILNTKAPILNAIGSKSIYANLTLTFQVSATDPQSDPLSYSTGPLPPGASFDSITRTFSWKPTSSQRGSYQISFFVKDPLSLQDSETIRVDVLNNPPIVGSFTTQSVYVNQTLSFVVTASDFDNDTITLSAYKLLLPGATFPTVSGVGSVSSTFTWKPSTVGNYYVTFQASDPYTYTRKTIQITVKSSSGGCFLSGTPILMADGSLKPIEEVKVGEFLLAFDEKTKTLKQDKVKEFFTHEAEEYLIINGTLKVTPNHPVYSNGKWVEIGTLKVGDTLLNREGKPEPTTSIQRVKEPVKVYNLEVNPYHTYVAGGVVVHNKATQ